MKFIFSKGDKAHLSYENHNRNGIYSLYGFNSKGRVIEVGKGLQIILKNKSIPRWILQVKVGRSIKVS